jgi:hypothetical protein
MGALPGSTRSSNAVAEALVELLSILSMGLLMAPVNRVRASMLVCLPQLQGVSRHRRQSHDPRPDHQGQPEHHRRRSPDLYCRRSRARSLRVSGF